MTQKDGVILSPSSVLCPLPPAPVPVQQLHWEPFPPSGNAPHPQGKPLVVSHFPMTPLVAGHSGYGQTGPGPFNIPARTQGGRRRAGSLLTQSQVLSWAPFMSGSQGVRHGGVHHPALLPLSAAPMTTILPALTGVSIQDHDGMWAKGLHPSAIPLVAQTVSGVNTGPLLPAPTGVSIQAHDGMWAKGLHPSAIPPVAPTVSGVNTGPLLPALTGVSIQDHDGMWAKGLHPPAIPAVAPAVPGVNTGPPPHCNSVGVLGTSQTSGSAGHTSKSPSVYENFWFWQHLKTLLQRYLPHTPDMEVVSCFLMPVLRSLSRRKPTMTVEQGLWIGVREWDHNSNYERMIFYELAENVRPQADRLQDTGCLPPSTQMPAAT